MGRRRKAAKKVVKKKKATIPKQFKCPFCNHERSVKCTMDWESKVGELKCGVCGANFQASINYLSEPVDVYSDWIDACESENAESGALVDEVDFRAQPREPEGLVGDREDDEEDLY
ncbi:MAG: transcription elongation factor 1 family protein [Bacteroidota bacterium]